MTVESQAQAIYKEYFIEAGADGDVDLIGATMAALEHTTKALVHLNRQCQLAELIKLGSTAQISAFTMGLLLSAHHPSLAGRLLEAIHPAITTTAANVAMQISVAVYEMAQEDGKL